MSKIVDVFRERAAKLKGASVPGEPDCMYWLKHHEAMLIGAVLDGASNAPTLDAGVRRAIRGLLTKVATQWLKYDKHLEEKP